MEVRVEEQVELLHLHARELGEEKVSALVDEHQQAQAENKLQCFYQYYFHWNVVVCLLDGSYNSSVAVILAMRSVSRSRVLL